MGMGRASTYYGVSYSDSGVSWINSTYKAARRGSGPAIVERTENGGAFLRLNIVLASTSGYQRRHFGFTYTTVH